MSCSFGDGLFAWLLGALIAVGVFASWWHSSLVKLLELRHPTFHTVLGKPSPPLTADSSSLAAGIFRFIVSGEYKVLHDQSVARHARVLQACAAVSGLVVVSLVTLLLLSPTPEATATLQCILRH